MADRSALERFNEKFVVSSNGCWEWIGARSTNGYAKFWDGTQPVYCHRWSYEHFIRPIPLGLVIDHLCRNHACVRPDHLEAVTQQINNRRGTGWPGRNVAKTHCPQGHPYSAENTKVDRLGRRTCRTCNRERQRKVQPASDGYGARQTA